jgi:hypothetical protein
MDRLGMCGNRADEPDSERGSGYGTAADWYFV